MIQPYRDPLMGDTGLLPLQGALFNSAIMKTYVICPAFWKEFPEPPFEAAVAVFDRPEDCHDRLDHLESPINETTILVICGTSPVGRLIQAWCSKAWNR